MMIKALIFDVDGTLAETEGVHLQAFNAAFKDFGLDWHWNHSLYLELLNTTGGKERITQYIDDHLKLDIAEWRGDIPALHAAKTAHYVRIISEGGLRLRPGVEDLIEQAKQMGLVTAIATTTSRANIDSLVQSVWHQPVKDIFPVIACGDEVARKKPDPDVFELALERLELEPGACLAFEDSANGLQSACAAGLKTVVTPSAYSLNRDFVGAAVVLEDVRGFDLVSALQSFA